ncbi:hypothetical protein DFS34DRAFT_676751 [Phlyctochytrium arcticum]|nr:hypothetical protein DFS34DRAFT_676751 [Phlyctochytrium arcticum]
MPPKPTKISKNDISNPTPLLSPEQAQAAAAMGDVLSYFHRHGADSGISIDEKLGTQSLQSFHHMRNQVGMPRGATSHSRFPHQPSHAIAPFSSGRFDSSASVAGGPNDPKLLKAQLPPPRLTMRQYQSFVQALAVYRRQVQALAAASETFVRELEDIAEFVPAATIKRPHVIGDLDFLIDSTHLIANAHQTWGETLEREFEAPLSRDLQEIAARASSKQADNKKHIAQLVQRLNIEEDKAHKLGKKKPRDVKALQSFSLPIDPCVIQSLNVRMSLADEVKRLTIESQSMHDIMSHQHMEYILEHCASGVRAELENYETVYEGLKKLGAFSEVSDFPRNYQTRREGRFSMVSHESATPTGPNTEVLPSESGSMSEFDEYWDEAHGSFDVDLPFGIWAGIKVVLCRLHHP